MAFTHLHVHTSYSILDGSNKISEYIKRLKELGMTSAAITDHGNMYGAVEFYKAAKKEGIKPIIGCEVYVAPESRFKKEGTDRSDIYYHLILLAENDKGYANLMKIVSKGFVEGFYYKPRVDKEVLREYHEGIIASSACLAGEVARNISRSNYEGAKEAALEYQDIFGRGNFFLELMDHGILEQKHVNASLVRISAETGIPLICTNDVHYTYAEDAESHDILLCIQTNRTVDDEDRMRYEGGQYYLKSEEEMRELFGYVPEAVENTAKIADRCNVEIVFHEKKLPRYQLPPGREAYEYLRELCYKGAEELYPEVTDEVKNQLEYELKTIKDMGYVDYFLIVWDFIRYAKSKGIGVGPGRGSAAGSIVSYTLGITKLDPIKYNLIFERFLNPERVTMPDIDLDFDSERRGEVIDYVIEKYGQDKVVQIISFGTMAAKGVIRDVGRALNMPYGERDAIAKMIPARIPGVSEVTLEAALAANPELRSLYESDEKIHYLIDISKKLEGIERQITTHPAGVLICQEEVDKYVPLSVSKDGNITTQYTMGILEELGLLKMDFLGLRNVTLIKQAVDLVNSNKPEGEPPLDIDLIDYNDKNVLDMISKGNTLGVFQLESAGMTNFMKELKPDSLEDIIAGVALYRPGPMDFIPKYIAGKQNPDTVIYDCPEMKPILENTHGCIVYQEQVMQIVRDLAGYTYGRSDLVRRAMSKKKADVMEKERHNFVYGNKEEGVPGCVARGISPHVADHIFDEMTDFANYAFNRAHAAVYAYVAFQTGYLKYYYPVEFMAALMTSVIDFPAKCADYILHCRDMNIEVLPPSVNYGSGRFAVEDGKIRYALQAIKNVGAGLSEEIAKEREKAGPYLSLTDFLKRMNGKGINKRAVENFIKAGAFDGLGANRRQLLMTYSLIMDNVDRELKESISGQMTLMDFLAPEEKSTMSVPMPDVPELKKSELLSYEKEVLGLYVSGHPLEDDEELWKKTINATSADFRQSDEEDRPQRQGGRATIGGIITAKKLQYTRSKQVMAFITLEDLLGSVEVVIFPKVYENFSHLLVEDSKVFIEGRISEEEDRDNKLLCEKIWRFEDAEAERTKEIWIQFENRAAYDRSEGHIESILRENPGNDIAVIYLRSEKAVKKMRNLRCKGDTKLVEKFRSIYGKANVRVVVK